jgi:hypothetical protein
LQSVTKARIRIDQTNLQSKEEPRPLHLSGGTDNIIHAKRIIKTLTQAEGEHYKNQVSSLLEQANSANMVVVDIPQMAVGRLKGRGGETIRQLTTMTKTKIDIDLNTGTEMARITIKGMNITDVRKCHDSLQDLCLGSGRGFPAFDNIAASRGQSCGYHPAPLNYGNFKSNSLGLNWYGEHGRSYSSQLIAKRSKNESPTIWAEICDDQCRTYYYNLQSGISQWREPNPVI